MPFINLIQEQRLAVQRQENRLRMSFMTLLGSAGLSVGIIGFLMFQKEMLINEQADLEGKAEKLMPLARSIQTNKLELSKIEPRLNTLQGAQVVTGRWSRILEHLAQQTPKETWLTSLRCTVPDPTKAVGITFAGLSTRQELIGDFILALQKCTDLSNVNLKFTQEKMAASGRDIEFEINSDIPGTAEEAKKEDIKKEGNDETKS